MGGLPATGKSSISRQLARERPAFYVRIDRIEQTIVETSSLDAPLGPVGYEVGFAVAAEQLQLGLDVVAESVNPLAITRDAWRRVGTDAGARVVETEIVCSDPEEHRRRAEGRSVDIAGLRLPTWQQIQDREYEPWARDHLVLDTARLSVAEAVAEMTDAAERTPVTP